jgi:formiminotetrahydrofolate cyclodeaminase
LATERALIDDSGDGVGKEVNGEGSDGTLAARLFIGAERREISEVSDKILGPLFAKQAVLESEISNLRINRSAMSEADYRDILERLLIELASVSREIRRRIPK